MLDWRVDTFLDVCETLNYTHTASRLNVTQPAVSQHISWLEKQLGVDLFLRRGRSLVLTQAGVLARDLLRSQRNDERLLCQRLEEQSSGHSTLSIGATLTAGEYLLAKPLALWCKNIPRLMSILIWPIPKICFKNLMQARLIALWWKAYLIQRSMRFVSGHTKKWYVLKRLVLKIRSRKRLVWMIHLQEHLIPKVCSQSHNARQIAFQTC